MTVVSLTSRIVTCSRCSLRNLKENGVKWVPRSFSKSRLIAQNIAMRVACAQYEANNLFYFLWMSQRKTSWPILKTPTCPCAPSRQSRHLNSQLQQTPRHWLVPSEVPSLPPQAGLYILTKKDFRDCWRRALRGSYRSLLLALSAGKLPVQARSVTLTKFCISLRLDPPLRE